jgi:hypothetical protein
MISAGAKVQVGGQSDIKVRETKVTSEGTIVQVTGTRDTKVPES